jgi:arginine/lysine/ornithine decarboxylase
MELPDVPPTVRDVLGYFANEQASFHMPGHKQRGGYHPLAPSILGEPALRNDVGEIGGFDYIHAPEGSIAEAQKQCAQIFGAQSTYFLINGSTVGNLAALLSHAFDGDSVVALRGSHRSVYSAIGLSGANPTYLPMAYDDQHQGWFVPKPPTTLPYPPGVIHVTRPNYYGMTVDLAPYRSLADEHGAVLIVDEAHGTHFGVDPRLPASALQCGADIVIQSTHKTLSALTQSSMLHVGADAHGRVNHAALAQSLAMLQSSSPSALLSVSLDLAAHEHARDGFAATRRVVDIAEATRGELNERLTRCVLVSFDGVATDPTKLVIDVGRTGLSGFDARTWLRAEHGVGVELADHRRIVCSLTVGDDEATAQLLIDVLLALDKLQKHSKDERKASQLQIRSARFAPNT